MYVSMYVAPPSLCVYHHQFIWIRVFLCSPGRCITHYVYQACWNSEFELPLLLVVLKVFTDMPGTLTFIVQTVKAELWYLPYISGAFFNTIWHRDCGEAGWENTSKSFVCRIFLTSLPQHINICSYLLYFNPTFAQNGLGI